MAGDNPSSANQNVFLAPLQQGEQGPSRDFIIRGDGTHTWAGGVSGNLEVIQSDGTVHFCLNIFRPPHRRMVDVTVPVPTEVNDVEEAMRKGRACRSVVRHSVLWAEEQARTKAEEETARLGVVRASNDINNKGWLALINLDV